MKLFKVLSIAAIAAGILYIQALDPYSAQQPNREVADYRVLEERDSWPVAETRLLSASSGRVEASDIAQDYAAKRPDVAALKIEVLNESRKPIARAAYCFETDGISETKLSPGERRFEHGEELEDSDTPPMD